MSKLEVILDVIKKRHFAAAQANRQSQSSIEVHRVDQIGVQRGHARRKSKRPQGKGNQQLPVCISPAAHDAFVLDVAYQPGSRHTVFSVPANEFHIKTE